MPQKRRHPLLLLMFLVTFALGGALGALLVTALIIVANYGFDGAAIITDPNILNDHITLVKAIQILSSIGMFVLPPLLLARLESKRWVSYLKLHKPTMKLVVLTALIMLVSLPLIEYLALLNEKMHLPEGLKALENWMRNKESEAQTAVNKFLVMDGLDDLSINLLMLALIPALGEELFFRGCMQPIFSRWTKNKQVGIWLTAIIFSAIHVQFFGFVPRMLLGALFGYLLLWSNKLWLPILAHFINNATLVITTYIYQRKGFSIDQINQLEKEGTWPMVYLFSFVALVMLMYHFYKQTSSRHQLM